MAITRTIRISDLTVEEVAEAFIEMDATQQAAFFAEVWRIALDWPGAGWRQQSCAIADKLTPNGRSAIKALAAHLED